MRQVVKEETWSIIEKIKLRKASLSGWLVPWSRLWKRILTGLYRSICFHAVCQFIFKRGVKLFRMETMFLTYLTICDHISPCLTELSLCLRQRQRCASCIYLTSVLRHSLEYLTYTKATNIMVGGKNFFLQFVLFPWTIFAKRSVRLG